VNVVNTEKEIASLITLDDIQKLKLEGIDETVVISGRAIVHERPLKRRCVLTACTESCEESPNN
jgi:NifB/MoaA-like Fe-S oxidoreductase